MQIKSLNKTLLVAMLTVSLAACNNSTANTNNSADSTEVVTEDNKDTNDIIDESIKDADENKAADSDEVEEIKKEDPNKTEAEKKESSEQEKSTSIDVNKEEKKENKVSKSEDTEQETNTIEQNNNQINNNEDMNYQTEDGRYVSTLIASKQGVRDAEMSIADTYSVEAKDGALTVKGSMDHMINPGDYENAKELDNNTYNFKINENTKFQATGGMAEPQTFTIDEFNEYYKGITESGLALIVEVKDGIAQTVSFSS